MNNESKNLVLQTCSFICQGISTKRYIVKGPLSQAAFASFGFYVSWSKVKTSKVWLYHVYLFT